MDTRSVVAAAHVLILGPLLIAIGLGWFSGWRFYIGVLGIFITVYHAVKVYMKYQLGQSAWINWIHVLFVGPVLVALGFMQTPPRYLQEITLMMGIAAVGYHGLTLVANR